MSNAYETIKKYEPLWGKWKVDSLIGEGTYGSVFKIYREEWGQRFESACKLISYPKSEADINDAYSIGVDEGSMHSYFSDFTKNIVSEIELMHKLKGDSNIVSYEDHDFHLRSDGIGYDILIRMELLTPLNSYIKNRILDSEEVLKIGLDICKGLESCQKLMLIHRDIKDANIFVSSNGNFKLGDFGIAKEFSKTGGAGSSRGTPLYMAQEIVKNQNYDHTVDLYSLGIVLYKLANKGRYPFVPQYPDRLSNSDFEKANMRRLSGEPLPAIPYISPEFSQVILKACSFNAEDRYPNARKMREALDTIIWKTVDVNGHISDSEPISPGGIPFHGAETDDFQPVSHLEKTTLIPQSRTNSDPFEPVPTPNPTLTPNPAPNPAPIKQPPNEQIIKKGKKIKKWIALSVSAVAVLAIVAFGASTVLNSNKTSEGEGLDKSAMTQVEATTEATSDVAMVTQTVTEAITEPMTEAVTIAPLQLEFVGVVPQLTVGNVHQFKINAKIGDLTNKTTIWLSSNPAVASIDTTGLLTVLAAGTVNISAQVEETQVATTLQVIAPQTTVIAVIPQTTIPVTTKKVPVKVPKPTVTVAPAIVKVSSLKISNPISSLALQKSHTFTISVMPQNAANKILNWSSSNNKIATVSSAGAVKALAPGDVTITAKSADGGAVTLVKLNVKPASIKFADAGLELAIRENLGIPSGDIYQSDLNKIRILKAPSFRIKSITGISKLYNLLVLDLSSNAVSDISEIKKLSSLTYLDLRGNDIVVIEHVLALKNLDSLFIKGNPIPSYDVLQPMLKKLTSNDFAE